MNIKASSRNYRTKEAANDLYEQIHEASLKLLSRKLSEYRLAMTDYLIERQQELAVVWTGNNEQVLADIAKRQSQQLDDRVVTQIRAAIQG
jgi:uncharacterized membrane protein YfbV (UPF0208 family)